MINVILVDDQPIFRKGFKELLKTAGEFDLIGEAACDYELPALLRQRMPDVLIMAISAPGICRIELIAQIHRQHRHLPILALGLFDKPMIATLAIKAGAYGYLSKDRDPSEILAALRKLAGGGKYIESKLAERLLFDDDAIEAPYHALTDRERGIFDLLVLGIGANEIANELCISNKTVSTHKVKLLEKMKMKNTAELVKYAVQNGLLV